MLYHEILLYFVKLCNIVFISVKVEKMYAQYCQNDLENSSNVGRFLPTFVNAMKN